MPEVCGPSGLPIRTDGKPQGGAIPVACFDIQPHVAKFILVSSNLRPRGRFEELLRPAPDSFEPSPRRRV